MIATDPAGRFEADEMPRTNLYLMPLAVLTSL